MKTANRLKRRLWLSLLGAAVVASAGLAAPARAADPIKINVSAVGRPPIFSNTFIDVAQSLGYFKDAGLDVEPLKFASAQQVMEAMLSGRAEGSANGTASAVLAIGEIAQPGLFKIFCTNPTNAKYVLDEFIVAKDSPVKTLADLKGKRVASGPGIQNTTLAKTMLERAGAGSMQVTELPIGQHVAAIASGQVDGIYTLEPTGTVGRLNGTTRNLEVGVVAKYVLGDPMAPWHGGSATLTSEFIKAHPDVAKKYMAAYRKGVDLVKSSPAEARPFLKGYTAIEGPLTAEVPMSDYLFSSDFKPADVAYFQKFFDLFTEKGIFEKKLDVGSLLYKA